MPFPEDLSDVDIDILVVKFYANKVRSCKERGIEWQLTFAQTKTLLKAKKCYYTGVELTIPVQTKELPTDVTLDRIDSSKDYVQGNVVACCRAINQLKSMVENPQGILSYVIAAKVFNKVIKHISEQK